MLCDAAQVRLPSLAWGEAGYHPMWHEPGWLHQQHRLPSASCDSVRFAQFCLLSQRSREMCPTLLSLLSLGESRNTWLKRVPVEIGGSSHHWPGSLHESAKTVGSIGTSHIWHAFPSRIPCESEDLGSCEWSSLSLISLLSRAFKAYSEDKWGLGWERCVSTVRALCPMDPRSPLSPEVSLALDSGREGTVWSLGAGS